MSGQCLDISDLYQPRLWGEPQKRVMICIASSVMSTVIQQIRCSDLPMQEPATMLIEFQASSARALLRVDPRSSLLTAWPTSWRSTAERPRRHHAARPWFLTSQATFSSWVPNLSFNITILVVLIERPLSCLPMWHLSMTTTCRIGLIGAYDAMHAKHFYIFILEIVGLSRSSKSDPCMHHATM